jgi:glycosyltransferase involved in cell wall biosynthesis
VSDQVVPPANGALRPLKIAMIGLRGIPATHGGVERAVEELSAHLVARGHEITVYARSAYAEREVTRHRGVQIRRLPQINTKHLEAASHTMLALSHAMAARRYDVIHLHATGPGAMSVLPRAFGIPVVVTIQGLDWRREKWGRSATAVLRVASRLAVNGPDRAIVVSRELERYYRDELRTRTTYIPNGVAPDPTPGAPAADLDLQPGSYFLYLGRLVPEKHVHTLIRAFELVEGDVSLVIAGPGTHSPEYVAELHRLADRDLRIRLVGARYGSEKAWLMQNALAFVQPSSIEGLPIALLEALSRGRFPIVSEIPENLEPVTIDEAPSGETFPVGDVAALARAMDSARRRDDREEVGVRLARFVDQQYDWRSIAEQTELVYREVMSS